jgi:hypothetical protein
MDDKPTPSEGQLAFERFTQKLKNKGYNVVKKEVSDEEQPLVATFVSGKRLPIENKDTKQEK